MRDTGKANKAALKKLLASSNIAEDLDDDQLSLIGDDVVRFYEEDDNSPTRIEKKAKWENGKKLANQTVEPRDEGANIKFPLLSVACIQFSARAYPELVNGWNVAKPKLVGEVTEEKRIQAHAVCNYVNWQLFNGITEWEEDTDKMLQMLPAYGNMFREISSSKDERRLVTDICTPEQIVVPEGTKNMLDASRVSKKFELPPREVIGKIRAGSYRNIDHPFEDEESEQGEEFIQQFTWLDLDDDGFKEPYCVVVHVASGEVVKISPNYRDDGVHWDGERIIKIDPIRYYVKYTFIPSMDNGFYDLGFYDLLYPLNETVNTIINQLVDAGTLANSNTGLISKQLAMRKRGQFKVKIGEYSVVDAQGQDLRNGIMPLNFKGADSVLFSLLGFVLDAGRDVAQLKEVLEGTSASTATATTTMALIEQGLKVFSAIYKRIHRSLREELQVIREWDYYSTNPMYDEVLDLPNGVNPEWFNDEDLNFEPVSDPTVVTDLQRMARLEFKKEFLNDPYHDPMKLREQIYKEAEIGDFNEVRAGQNPEVQQLQEQLQQAMQQMQKMAEAFKGLQAEHERMKSDKTLEQQNAVAELDGDNAVKMTTAIKNIAEAESKEPGKNIPEYRAQV